MQLITKDEATAAQRTLVFYATDATDGFTPETAIDFSDAGDVKLSKAGAALANATGVVTELATGAYKLVLSAGDVDTLGHLFILITNAGVRPIRLECQVTALDQNVATVNPGAGGITAATIATDAITGDELSAAAVTKLQVGLATSAEVAAITLATRTVVKDLGRMEVDGHANTDGDFVAISILDCIDATVEIAGTWNGATATVYTTVDPAADPVVWTAYDDEGNDNPLTADGTVIVAGGAVSAVKVEITNDGAATDLGVSVSIRKPAGA